MEKPGRQVRRMPEEERPQLPVVAQGKALRHSDEEEAAATSAAAMQVLAEEAGRTDWIENAPRKKTLLESRTMK